MKKLLPLLIMITLAGCKKDTDALLTRSWKVTAITTKTNGVSTPMNITPCSASRIWTFNDDKSFLTEPSPNCTPDGLDFPLSGTWNLIDNKTLQIEAQGGSAAIYLETQIVTVTKSKLVLHSTTNGGGGFGGGGFPVVETITELVPNK